MSFTAVLGFMFLLFWFCVGRGRQANANLNHENEPGAEPAVSSDPTVFYDTLADEDHQQPADGRQRTEPTVEGYLNWLIEPCCRRRDSDATTERRLLY